MLINHDLVVTKDGDVVVTFGGGNCFSFGSHFNAGALLLSTRNVEVISSPQPANPSQVAVAGLATPTPGPAAPPTTTSSATQAQQPTGASTCTPVSSAALPARATPVAACIAAGRVHCIAAADATPALFADVLAKREPVVFTGLLPVFANFSDCLLLISRVTNW